MTLTVRSATVTGATTKGSPLTHAELDENFNHLSQSSNLSFTQPGIGAIARDLQTRGREWVMATDYPTLAAAYASLPSTGGTVVVPPNYSETLTADITLSKPYGGFLFLGPASITMGTQRVLVTAGVDGAFLKSLSGAHGSEHTGVDVTGVVFTYTGSTSAFAIGDNTADTENYVLDNFTINTDGGSSGATGVKVTRGQFGKLNNLCIGQSGGGTGGQLGIVLDGNGNYTGYTEIHEPIISGGSVGIQTLNQVNHTRVTGGTLNCVATNGTIGIDRQGNGTGFVAIGLEVGSWVTGVKLGGSTSSDLYIIRVENNTTDFSAAASSTNHRCSTLGSNSAVTFSDSGTGNVFYKTADMGAGTLQLNGAGKAYLTTDAADVVAQKNGSTGQSWMLYNTISGSDYERLSAAWSGNAFRLLVQANGTGTARSFRIGTAGANVFRIVTNGSDRWDFDTSGHMTAQSNLRFAHGTSALATNATEGFFHIQSCAGAPSGTPASIPTGQIPMVWDSTNLQLYVYTGGAWKKSAVFT